MLAFMLGAAGGIALAGAAPVYARHSLIEDARRETSGSFEPPAPVRS
ncbi:MULTISPECIES: hypothetical protein [Methylobacterium]|uniref:Uncharacterized protein n=1 Tax=Methylobacterium jeotgali TaxID=381630 RepID=A0ABQ4SQT0_9HYPH|nr:MULTISPECIES: hypothetical protein [Methylobacterium]GBU16625.1 hypothetical protein AwMethylo_08400 [Methylobacterium sp.]GJE05579.1 hypothetical protein AOPFMNJM_0882 [Methylobacterium jeotgali]